MTLVAWSIAAAVCLFGWLIVWDEILCRQPWRRRVIIVTGWLSITWAVWAAFPMGVM